MGELEAARRALAVADEVLRRELLAGLGDVLSYSGSLIKKSIPEAPRDRQWSRDLLDHIQKQEYPGHSTRHLPGDGPTSGFMISRPEHAGKPYPYAEVTPERLDSYADEVEGVVNDSGVDSMGGWEEDGLWYDDVSENDLNPWSAATKANDREEKAVWDHNQGKSIPTDEMMYQTHWGGDPEQPGWVGANGFFGASRRSR